MSAGRSDRAYAPGGRRSAVLIGLLLTQSAVDAGGVGVAVCASTALRRLGWETRIADLPGGCLMAWGAVRMLQFVVLLPVSVAFCYWLYYAHANLGALGARGLRFSPGWAVGWLFVPIYGLFRPLQVVQEIWRASDSSASGAAGAAWKQARGSPLVTVWWVAVLLAMLGHDVANDLSELGLSSMAVVTAKFAQHLVGMIAAALYIAVVVGVHRRQELRAWQRGAAVGAQG